jgi:chemotaxis family two-component system response regulator Rcp1
VLAEIKTDPVLMLIPVIILTTSDAEQDIINTYAHHANCYITKPVDFNQFMNVIESIQSFWLTVVKLPTKEIKKEKLNPV